MPIPLTVVLHQNSLFHNDNILLYITVYMHTRFVDLHLLQTTLDFPKGLPTHTVHELVCLLGGRYRVRIDKQTLTGSAGDVFLFPKGQRHAPVLENTVGFRFFCLHWTDSREGYDDKRALKVYDRRGRITALLQWLWEAQLDALTDRTLCDDLLTVVLAEHARLSGQHAPSFARRVDRYMEENLHRRFTLKEIGAALDLSACHVLRRYRSETGKTPGARLQELRVERILNLLQTTPDPLKTVADAVGLSSVSHLINLVKRHTGRTPATFRRNVLQHPGA